MSFSGRDSRERVVLLASVGLVVVVFVAAFYSYMNPPEQVWEVKVFQVFQDEDSTVIYSYGNGKLKLNGVYDIEVDETYRIYYRTRTRNAAEFDIRIEKIS